MALKKKVFVISASVILLIILIIGCIFALRPVYITESYMLTENFPSSENFEYRLGAISRQDDDDAQIFYPVDNYPSYDYGDYRVICIDFIFQNISPFSAGVNRFSVSEENGDNFVMYKAPMVKPTQLDPNSKNDSADGIRLVCFCKDMSDEEIVEKIKNTEISVYYNTKFFKDLSFKTKLKDIKLVTEEELCEIKKVYDTE